MPIIVFDLRFNSFIILSKYRTKTCAEWFAIYILPQFDIFSIPNSNFGNFWGDFWNRHSNYIFFVVTKIALKLQNLTKFSKALTTTLLILPKSHMCRKNLTALEHLFSQYFALFCNFWKLGIAISAAILYNDSRNKVSCYVRDSVSFWATTLIRDCGSVDHGNVRPHHISGRQRHKSRQPTYHMIGREL